MGFSFHKGDFVTEIEGACVPARYIVLGFIANNVYLIDDGEGGVVVIDPCARPEAIVAAAQGAPIRAIVLTHNHYDHVGALAELQRQTGAVVYASESDAPLIQSGSNDRHNVEPCAVDVLLSDGDHVQVGALDMRVLATPGHTRGSICLYIDPAENGDSTKAPLLISGDTLFDGCVGRTDFEGGSMDDMVASLRVLRQLPAQTIVAPGHNSLTTIEGNRESVFEQYL